jgi:hypothetical protein
MSYCKALQASGSTVSPSFLELLSCFKICCLTPLLPQVSQAGEVVYAFDRDFVGKIRQRSWLQRLRPLWKRVVNVGSYVARVAFGTALVVSALLVWLAVIAITSSRDDNRCAVSLQDVWEVLLCRAFCVGRLAGSTFTASQRACVCGIVVLWFVPDVLVSGAAVCQNAWHGPSPLCTCGLLLVLQCMLVASTVHAQMCNISNRLR